MENEGKRASVTSMNTGDGNAMGAARSRGKGTGKVERDRREGRQTSRTCMHRQGDQREIKPAESAKDLPHPPYTYTNFCVSVCGGYKIVCQEKIIVGAQT